MVRKISALKKQHKELSFPDNRIFTASCYFYRIDNVEDWLSDGRVYLIHELWRIRAPRWGDEQHALRDLLVDK